MPWSNGRPEESAEMEMEVVGRLMMVAEKGISLRTKIQNNMHDNGGCGC